MISTPKSRKRNASTILTKVNNLDQEASTYKQRLDDSINKLVGNGEEDANNRESMEEYVHLYSDIFEELKVLNRYKWNEDNNARLFFNSTTISLSRYFPGWSEFISGDKTFKDNDYLWKVFSPYSSGRDTQKINKLTFWDSDELTPPNQNKSIPKVPSVKEFQNCIVPLDELSYAVALDVVEDCKRISTGFLNGESSIKQYNYDSYMKQGAYNARNDFHINPNNKVSYLKFNDKIEFGDKSYLISAHDNGKTENFVNTLINGDFKKGMLHFFISDDGNSYGIGKVVDVKKRAVRISLKSQYLSQQGQDQGYSAAMFDSSDIYWECEYYADITFGFLYIKGTGEIKMKDFDEVSNPTGHSVNKALSIIQSYHTDLKNFLTTAKSKYEATLETIRTSDNGKYAEFIKYLNEAKYDNLHNAVLINNTINNSINNWINKRIKDLFNTVKDETAADCMRNIISDRMNKSSGTLYSWYAYDSIPLGDIYDRYKQRVKDSLYVFKSSLVALNAGLDYKLEENGGQELYKPNFFDIEASRYRYYKMAGVNTDFNTGDSVYIFDDNNAELSAKIINTKYWTAKDSSNEDIQVKRLTLNITIPDSYDYSTLKIVKLL